MIIFIGDIHGDFKELTARFIRNQIRDSYLIQVGDFGVGFRSVDEENIELDVLNSFLNSGNNMLYVVRGNHDDPSYFQKNSGFSNIIYLADYSVINLDNLNLLCVGGALSVDRASRTVGKNYWVNERFIYDGAKLVDALEDISTLDIIVTHNAPSEFWPYEFDYVVTYFARRDPTILRDLKSERADISKLLRSVMSLDRKPKQWFYGHFHSSNSGKWNDIESHALGIMEFFKS